MLPSSTPKATLADIDKILKPYRKALEGESLIVVGVPGYYSKMGATPGNDRGVYDDAMFIVSPTHFSAWNANVDPSLRWPRGFTATKRAITVFRAPVVGILLFVLRRRMKNCPCFVMASKRRGRGWRSIFTGEAITRPLPLGAKPFRLLNGMRFTRR
jgi:hypothetical protein